MSKESGTRHMSQLRQQFNALEAQVRALKARIARLECRMVNGCKHDKRPDPRAWCMDEIYE